MLAIGIGVLGSAAPRTGSLSTHPSMTPQAPAPTGRDSVSDRPPGFLLPPPSGLTNADDPKICGAHGGVGAGLACKALLPLGRLALVWEYPARTDVIGFHIYRVDGDQHALVAEQSNGAAVKAYVIDPPPEDGYAAACYAVSAFSASQESSASSPFCGAQARLAQTLSLSPTAVMSSWMGSSSSSTGVSNGSTIRRDVDNRPSVGFQHSTQKNVFGDLASNTAYRLGIYFDISPVMHRKIRSARLQLEVASTWQGKGNIGAPFPHYQARDVPSDHQSSCAAILSEGTARWWNYTEWILDSPVKSAAAQGPDISIDVTDIVNGWANDRRENFGFVLKGEDEDLTAFTERSCVTQYVPASLKLVIQYD